MFCFVMLQTCVLSRQIGCIDVGSKQRGERKQKKRREKNEIVIKGSNEKIDHRPQVYFGTTI